LSEPLHLALFVRSLAGGGGAERVMVNLAGALAAEGHRVDFVIARHRGRLADAIPDSVRTVDLGAPMALAALPALLRRPGDLRAIAPAIVSLSAPRVLGAIPALASYLRRERPEGLLAALNYPNLTALLARDLAGVDTRCVISVHNHVTRLVSAATDARTRGLPPLMRRFFPRADEIVTVSDGVGDDLSRVAAIARTRITTIYNPVVTDDLLVRSREAVAEPWFREGQPPVLLGAGKLKPQKDFATLIRAFALVRAARPARLVILGEGPGLGALQLLARELGVADDVWFPGFVANPFAYMARAAVFVLSSAWEGFANVIVEAMHCGCPVVSTDCESGPREILEAGRHGRLVRVGDPEEMARAVLESLESPPAAAALRERASVFSDRVAARAYAELLRPR
jgi:glycosyltransferase involved in cell wall biosynthesis